MYPRLEERMKDAAKPGMLSGIGLAFLLACVAGCKSTPQQPIDIAAHGRGRAIGFRR